MENRRPEPTRRALLGLGLAAPFVALAAPARAATCGLTPAQTTGPFFPLYAQVDTDVDLTRLVGHGTPARGTVIRVEGRVLDTACRPVPGVRVDLWEANAAGRYSHPADPNPAPLDPNFQGWGQAVTDADGRYAFRTIKPAAYPLGFLGERPDPNAGFRTPQLHFRFTKRGYAELATQMYFAGEALNDADRVLARVPAAERARVVIAARAGADGAPPTYPFDATIAGA